MLDPLLLQQLRTLIGKPVEYRGKACRIIEILHSERALVLECLDQAHVIQANQYGEATRRVPQVHTLALFDNDGGLDSLVARWLG